MDLDAEPLETLKLQRSLVLYREFRDLTSRVKVVHLDPRSCRAVCSARALHVFPSLVGMPRGLNAGCEGVDLHLTSLCGGARASPVNAGRPLWLIAFAGGSV